MSITGNIKFFERNYALGADGATATVTSGDSSKTYMLGWNRASRWYSIGSSDSITETIEVILPGTKNCSRLAIVDTNLKQFTVSAWENGDHWSVITVSAGTTAQASAIETAYALDTYYIEFANVETDRIKIEAVKTQTANQEKFIGQVIVTEELGTFIGWPIVREVAASLNERITPVMSGRISNQKSYETFGIQIDFANYPASAGADLALAEDLFDRTGSFLVWLCGGAYGTTKFSSTMKGWRLKDFFNVMTVGPMRNSFQEGCYNLGVNTSLTLSESI